MQNSIGRAGRDPYNPGPHDTLSAGVSATRTFHSITEGNHVITDEQIADCVRERIAAALPNHIVRSMARQILRKELGTLTLLEAAKFLKWRDPEALRKKLRRAGVLGIKTSSRILTFAVPDLVAFREKCRQPKASTRSKLRVVKVATATSSVGEEGSRAA